MRLVPFQPVELEPGLVVRLLHEPEVAAHHALVLASDLYGDQERRVEKWWQTASIWPTVVTWRGTILQYDYFHLEDERHVLAGLTLRPSRDRAQWFWKMVRRPVLEQLIHAGYRTMSSAIRADRRDWIEKMKGMWQATETGASRDGRWVHLRYDLRTCLTAAGSPPSPRHLPGWTWGRDGVRVREATPEDISARLPVAIAADWGNGSPDRRASELLGRLDAGVTIDRGTVLVTEVDGRLDEIRLVRPRGLDGRGPVGGMIGLTRSRVPMTARHVVAMEGMVRWALAVGYREMVTWLPAAQLRVPAFIARMRHFGWAEGRSRRPGRSGENTEMRLNLRDALRIIQGAAA
jgi:hypothetical protein